MSITNKIFLLIIFAFTFSYTTVGQPLIGAHLGLNIANLSGDKNNDENMYRIGVSPYISLDFHISYILTLETGIAYSLQGMQRTRLTRENLSVSTTKTNYKLDYLFVPVYLKENFTNFYAKMGPYGAYLANGRELWEKTENASGLITNTTGSNLDFQESISPYDIGLSIGFGYIHYFDNRRRRRSYSSRRTTRVLQFDLQYNLGMISLDLSGNNPDLDVRNRVFSIGVSINSIVD